MTDRERKIGGEGWRELQRRLTKELSYEHYTYIMYIINHVAEPFNGCARNFRRSGRTATLNMWW
jgi:hypothetical protein